MVDFGVSITHFLWSFLSPVICTLISCFIKRIDHLLACQISLMNKLSSV